MGQARVCVTGSTHGIGYAIAEAFARDGARLVINSHEDDKGAADALSALTECHFVKADLSTVTGARHLVSTAAERLGGLDTLVCNAGTFADTAFDDLDEAAFEKTFDLNVKGYVFCAQTFARLLAPDQQNASIICIGSTNSKAAEKDSVLYDTSKGAILMMIRSLAVTLAGRGVRVNGLGPGIIETPLTRPGLDAGNTRKILARQVPMGRVGLPRDIGGAAVFLASPQASYITGQMIYIDGGVLANQMSWEDET